MNKWRKWRKSRKWKFSACLALALTVGLAGFGGLLALSACGRRPLSVGEAKEPELPKSYDLDKDRDGWLMYVEANPVDERFYGMIEQFAAQSGARVLPGEDNVLYSPISLYLTLSLASEGAKGAARDAFLETLGAAGEDEAFLRQQCGNLLRGIYSNGGKLLTFRTDSSLWLSETARWKDPFVKAALEDYYASLYRVDFQKEDTREAMESWIREHTNGVLNPRMQPVSQELLSILNTVYFHGEWIDEFQKADVTPGIFHTEKDGDVECSFLNRERNPYGYLRGDGFVRASLPFKENGNIFFVLPDEGTNIDQLASDPETLSHMLFDKEDGSAKVIFAIPKFSYGSELDLKETLTSMGLSEAFSETADYSPMTDDPVYLSGIRQQAHIALDEKGVEAAAFTQIQYSGAAMAKEEVVELILDRPFLYGIRYQGNLVFMGICRNPAAGE